MRHNGTSSSNRLVDMIVLISLSLDLSSKRHCNFFLKMYYILSFSFFFTANFHEINPLYLNRPFCPSVIWHCWFGYVACRNHPEMTYYVLGGMFNITHSHISNGTHTQINVKKIKYGQTQSLNIFIYEQLHNSAVWTGYTGYNTQTICSAQIIIKRMCQKWCSKFLYKKGNLYSVAQSVQQWRQTYWSSLIW